MNGDAKSPSEPLALSQHRESSHAPNRKTSRGLKGRRQQQPPPPPVMMDATVQVAPPPPPPPTETYATRSPAGVGGAPQGKMRASAATRPGAMSVMEPSASSEPGRSTGVGGAPQGKMRRSVSPVKPGAMSVVEPGASNGTAGVGGAPQGKMRRTTNPVVSRPGAMSVVEPAASRPGAMSVVEPAAGETGTARGVGGAPQGKMRRATASVSPSRPGAVAETPASAAEPVAQMRQSRSLSPGPGLSGGSAHARGLRKSQHGAPAATTMTSDVAGQGLRGSQHSRGLRRTNSNDGNAGDGEAQSLRGSAHRRGLKKSPIADTQGPNDSDGAPADPQAIRRKQIQDIMKDPNLSQPEKQGRIQQLMASGMPTPTEATPEAEAGDPQAIRRKQIQEIMKDSTLTQPQKQAKIQQLMAGGMPASAEEDPEAIRRMQVQEIMKDTSLDQREKQLKLQHLMAGGMPKACSASVASTNDLSDSSADGTPSPATSDTEEVTRREIQGVMMDPSLTAREKQLKTQEMMANASCQSKDTEDRKRAPGSRTNSPPPIPRRGLRKNRTFDSQDSSKSAGLRRNRSIDSHGSGGSGLRRTLSKDGAPRGGVPRRTRSRGNGTAPVPGSHLGSDLMAKSTDHSLNITSTHSALTMDSFHGHDSFALGAPEENADVEASSSSQMHDGGRISRRARNAARDTLDAAKAAGVDIDAREAVTVARAVHHGPTGVGGAPQGKMRRATGAAASRPGAVSVVEPTAASAEPGATTGVGGAPQGKMRRTTGAAAIRPGAVSVVEPTAASAEPGAMTGVGGAPQGKMRRAATTPATRPGAVSVVEPTAASAEPGATTGVGGAPQGKMRRTATAPASKPGAVSVVEPTAASAEPGATTGVGGAPQGKMRRTTGAATSRPGAVSVVEPTAASAEPGATTGVGGAPQGKMRRTVTAPTSKPGAVRVVEPTAGSTEPGATTGVGGAPQGKMRRTQTAAAATPGAVSVVEPNPPASESGAASGVGGAPQGKVRRAGTTPIMPGAVRAESGASTIDNSRHISEPSMPAGMAPRSLIGVSKEPQALIPAVTVRSVQASEHGVAPNSDMLAKSAVRRSRPATVRPGAQAVANVSPVEPNGEDNSDAIISAVERDMMIKSAHRNTTRVAPPALHNSVSEMSDKNQLEMSHSSVNASQANDPAVDADFNHAVQMVEDDLQIKMRMRAEALNGTVAGARRESHAEKEDALRKKDQYTAEEPVDDSYDDDELQKEKEKEMVRIGASSEPTVMHGRMEQKILQMEREQQSRDDKLEELEQVDMRNRGPERRKEETDPRSPMSDIFRDESDEVENGFLNVDPEAIRQAEEDGLAIAIAVDEDEEPDVYDAELKMYDPDAKPPFHKNRRFRCYAGLICFLTLGAIIMASVLSAQKAGDVILITYAPSAAPSMPPTTTRETAVRGELARVIGDLVNQADTPHDQAMDWILHVDPMELDEFSENLIQRYTMALFYYQTSTDNPWTSCNPPVEGEDHTCPFYEMSRNPDNSRFYSQRNDTEVRWLSEKHECEWAEVLCHPVTDGKVIGLDILGQNLTGSLPEELHHLDGLMWLSLSYNEFNGTIPEVYGEFPYMTIFEVTENYLTGQIPGGFFRQQNLLQLNPAFNLFTGTIPPEIGDLTTLHSMFWFNTMITGDLPTEIGLLEDIRNFWMYDNPGLTGPIPSEIGQLSLLEDLKLANNGHTGSLPSEMGLLSNMEEFLFSGNQMGGSTIPEELWNMTNTIFLDINDAGFGGTISTRIGQMSKLKGLKASRNSFSGTLPSEIGLLDGLLLLWIHVNEDLGGSVPMDVCRLRGPDHLMFLNADCGGSPARISCICCTGCCDEWGQCQLV